MIYLIYLIFTLHGCGNKAILINSDSADDTDAGDMPGEGDIADTSNESPCLSDADCSNGLFCDGEERCIEGWCAPGTTVTCDDGNDCTTDICSEEEGGCVFMDRDEDRDGFIDEACGGTDCDDTRDDIYPGAPEGCEEGEDRDCSGTPDIDDDLDGFLDMRCPDGDDCDDSDPDTYPGAPEVCLDGVDQDCDGVVDGPMLMAPNTKILWGGMPHISISLAWTGSEFGIAWDGIYFTCVNADGIEIREEVILTDTGCYGVPPNYYCIYSHKPSLVWTGSEFSIVYKRNRNRYETDIYFMRVSAQGIRVGDEIRVTYFDNRNNDMHPVLTWTGSIYGVAWDAYFNSDYHIYFKTLSSSGVEISEDVNLSSSATFRVSPRIAWTGSEFAVAWVDDDIYFTRVGIDGVEVDGETRLTDGHTVFSISDPVWTGSEFGITWNHGPDRINSDIYFARISTDGINVSGDIRLTEAESASLTPALAWSGSEYGVAWDDTRSYSCCAYFDLFFTRLTPSCEKIDEDIALGGGAWGERIPIDIAWTGSEFGVVWMWKDHDDSSNSGIYFNRIGFCD